MKTGARSTRFHTINLLSRDSISGVKRIVIQAKARRHGAEPVLHTPTRGPHRVVHRLYPRLPSPFHLPFRKDSIAELHPFSVTMIPPHPSSNPRPLDEPIPAFTLWQFQGPSYVPPFSPRPGGWREKCKVAGDRGYLSSPSILPWF